MEVTMVRRSIHITAAGAFCAVAIFAATASSALATPGLLGGLNMAGYCEGLGYNGTTTLGPVTLSKEAVEGPNFAYNNWACVKESGEIVPVATTGSAPSMTDACHVEYPAIASYAAPTDPNSAFSWNCYSLPPAAGPGIGQQDRAAASALLSTDQVQAEIAALKEMIAAHHLGPALFAGAAFLRSQSTQELIADVLGGYQLPKQQGAVTVLLGLDMIRAVFS
jgi:hypothetical protein